MADCVRLIAVETSTRIGRIALAENGCVVDEREITAGMHHGRQLTPMVDDAVRGAGWSPETIALVAVSIGPGSFTGLRIAVMFARTVAWRTGAGLVAVPTLGAVAANAPTGPGEVAAVTDAQRGGLYWAVYNRAGDGTLRQTGAEAVGPPEEVAAEVPTGAYVVGDGLGRYGPLFAGHPCAEERLWWPRASVVAELAWAMHLRGNHAPPEHMEPLYVRRPAPEEVRERHRRGGR